MAGCPRRTGDILFCVWVLSSVFGFQSDAIILHCDDVTVDSFGTCCPCFFPEICDTNQTCPEGYQASNISSEDCKPRTDTTTTITLTSTDVARVTTTIETENGTDSNSSVTEYQYVLCYKCRTDEYFDGFQCTQCDDLCLQCNDSGKENCNLCKFEYENDCVNKCPNGTNEVKNIENEGIQCINKTDNANETIEAGPSDSKDFPIAIVAGSVGGGLVLIVVVVIIILVIRRRMIGDQTNERSRMSKIIEERGKPEDKRDETQRPPRIRPPDYENQPKTIATLPRDIEKQTDNVLRYTKDPTANIQVGQAQKQSSSSRDSGLYENSAAIRIHQNFKGKRISNERLSEELEKAEVDELPAAPPPPGAKKKRGVINRISRRFAKSKNGSQVELVDEEYIDMEGVRTSLNDGIDTTELTEDQVQEEYEDVGVGNQNGGIDHEEEDYENLEKTTRRTKLTHAKAKNIKHEKKSYENEEVIMRLKKTDKPRDGDINEPKEVYENVQIPDPGHGTNMVDVSDQVGGKGQGSSYLEETGVDIVDSELEDYENTADLKNNVVELEPGRVESPYENVQFRRK